jgi:hypothetical protein
MRWCLFITRLATYFLVPAKFLVINQTAALFAQPRISTFNGICDASAGYYVTDKVLVVGNDEDNRLYVYKEETPDPVATMDIGAYFGSVGTKHEMDIEAAARQGDHIYWITSHGRSRKGNLKPDRYAFFATRLSPGKRLQMPTTKKPYRKLIEDMLAEPLLATNDEYGIAASTRLEVQHDSMLAPKREGFNIEALAPFGKEGLYIGLRNPLKDGKAILIPLLNPREVIEKNARARFAKPILLDFGGLSFRDMAYVPASNGVPEGYLIIAGSRDNSDRFGIFFWQNNQPPVPLSADLGGVRAEAILLHPRHGAKEALILSDDGRQASEGETCKDLFARGDLQNVRFRAVKVNLADAIRNAVGVRK